METLDANSREYWQRVLTAGGFAVVPRWTRDPRPGVAEHAVPLPDDLAAAGPARSCSPRTPRAGGADRRAGDRHQLRRDGGWTGAPVQAHDRRRNVARGGAARAAGAVGAVGARGHSRRNGGRDRAGLDGAAGPPSTGAVGRGRAPRRPYGAAAALPDRRAGRRSCGPDRLLPPDRARAGRRRPGRGAGPRRLLSPEELRFQVDGLAGPERPHPTGGSTSCSRSGCAAPRRRRGRAR